MVKTLTRNLISLFSVLFFLQAASLPVHFSVHQHRAQEVTSAPISLEVAHAQDTDCGLCAAYSQTGAGSLLATTPQLHSSVEWGRSATYLTSLQATPGFRPSARAPPFSSLV